MEPIIEVDDATSWPDNVLRAATNLAEQFRGSANYASDLKLLEFDEAFCKELAGSLVKAYHATRLLPHELALIREQGLLPLSKELVERRLNLAAQNSAITPAERDQLHAKNVFQIGNHGSRGDQVCLFLSTADLEDEASGVDDLLSTWGGEAIYWNVIDAELGPRLKGLGIPTLVVAGLDLSVSEVNDSIFPGVAHVFVGRLLDLKKCDADVLLHRPVPPEHILDFWQPGSPEYDRFSELPRP